MEKFFKLEEHKTDVRKEILAGVTTFLTMAYIIAVNPSILGATGMEPGAIVTSTCLIAGLATIFMGIYANLPFALASGMGLNAYFAYTVVIGMGEPWGVALAAVFVEGIIFILLSVTNLREAVVNAIPLNLKYAVTAGIGLFIAFLGLIGAGVVINNDATLVSMGNLTAPTAIIAFVGIIVIVILYKKNIRGAILWGIVASALLSWGYALISPEAAATYGIFLPQGIFKFESMAPIAGKLDFSYLTDPSKIMSFVGVVFAFLFVDFFDTVGTLVGVASKANMLDKDGKLPGAGKALMVDAVATTVGAVAGVSTVTTYVESSAGVAQGGRTGLTAVTTGVLFIIAMFFSPLFIAIPSCATAPALIVVGFFMIENIAKVNFSDFTEGVPAFLTMALMPLTYSIGDGLTIGILSYVYINLLSNVFSKEKKKVSVVMIVLGIIFTIKIIVTGMQ